MSQVHVGGFIDLSIRIAKLVPKRFLFSDSLKHYKNRRTNTGNREETSFWNCQARIVRQGRKDPAIIRPVWEFGPFILSGIGKDVIMARCKKHLPAYKCKEMMRM